MKKLLSLTFWCLLTGALFGQNISLQTPMLSGNPGDTLSFPIQATHFTDMISLQFSVNWDTAVVKYVSIDSYNAGLGINATSLGLAQKDDGRIGFSWDDANIQGVTLPGTVPFFTVNLVITGAPGDSSMIRFGSVPTTIFAAKFANGTFPTATVDTVSGKATVLQQVNCANFTASAAPTDPTCGQNNGSITVSTLGGTNPNSYVWNDGDTTNPRTNLPPGNYTVTVTDAATCTATASAALANQGLPPVSALNATPTGLSVAFTDASLNTPTSWAWDFGDGTSSVLQNPTHTYAAAGTYTVCLIASNSCGADTACDLVTIVAPPANNLTVLTHRYTGNPGDTVIVPIRALSFADMIALQFSVNWDTTVIKYVNTQGYHPTLGLTAVNFGTTQITDGRLGFSWDDVNLTGVTLPDTLDMFDIRFCIKGMPGDSTAVDFGNVPTAMFASRFAGGTFPTIQVDSLPGSVVVLGNLCAGFTATASKQDPTCGFNVGVISVSTTGGTAPYSYLWNDGDTTGQRVNVAPGTYSVTVTDANGCTATASATLTNQGLPPIANFGTNTTGFTVNFTDFSSNSPSTWSWDFGDGNTSTVQNPTHTYVNSGSYTACLIASNSCGSDTICLNVQVQCVPNWDPLFTGVSHNIIIPANANITVNGQAIPTGYYLGVFFQDFSGQWMNGGFVIWNGAATSMTVSGDDTTTPNVKEGFAVGDTFVWRVYQPCGCEKEADAVSYTPVGGLVTHTSSFAVNGISQVDGLSSNQLSATATATEACFGNPVNGTATVTPLNGCSPYKILWNTPNNDTTFTVTGLSPGYVSFTLQDSCGCVYQDSVDILLGPPPSVGIVASPSDTFCVGDTVSLKAIGGPFDTYQWSGPPGTPMVNSPTLQVVQQGLYTLFAIDSCGATATAFIFLVEKPLPTPTITASPDTIFCSGDSTVLDASGKYAAYRWYEASSPTLLGTNPSLTVFSAGTYIVEVDSNGCTGTDTIVINQYPAPMVTITASPDTIFCPGTSVTLQGSPGFSIYSWSTGDTSSSIVVNTAGKYLLTVVDANGCMAIADIALSQYPQPIVNIVAAPDSNFCPGDSVLLLTNPSSFVRYSWSNGDTVGSTVVTTPGIYTITVEDANGCIATDSININQYPQPVVEIDGDTAFCYGSTSVLSTIPSAFASYLWSTGASTPTLTVDSTGTYSVKVTDANGCTAEDSLFVLEYPKTVVQITSAQNFTLCNGQTDTLDAGAGFISYAWSTGDTTQSITVTTAGIYVVIVTDSNMCQASDTVNITVNPLPQPGIDVSPSTGFCLEDTVSLSVPQSYASYSWSTGASGSQILVTSPAIYSVTVTDTNNCVGMAMVDLTIAPVDTQEIFIRKGWSIISSYLCLDEKLMDSVFNPIDTAIWIVKEEAGQAYLPNMVNSIGDWDVRKGYRVKAYKDTVLQMLGQKVDHTQVGLNLPTGWSLISYLRDSAMAVAPALGTNIVSNLYLLKNQDGLAFIPSFSIDQVGNLAPGQGYWVKMITNDTLTYPTRMGYYEDWYARPIPALHFTLPANTGENATIILPVEGMEHVLKIGDEIALKGKNGVLAGTAVFDGRNLAIALWGDDPTTDVMEGLLPGDAFDFVRWDRNQQREVILEVDGNEELVYMPDAIMIVNFRKAETELSNGDHISYFPNPATSRIHFELDFEQAQQIELSLYDMTGRRVVVQAEQVAAGGHTFSIDISQLARGAYTFTIRHQGGVKRGKLILE